MRSRLLLALNLLCIFFLLLSYDTLCQQDPKTHYQEIFLAITKAEDKLAVATELVAVTEKAYVPSNIEYFNGYFHAANAIATVKPRLAITYIEKAIHAFKNNPVTYAVLDDNNLAQCYGILCTAYNTMGLNMTSLQILEAQKDHVKGFSNNGKCNYYNLLGSQYLSSGEYQKALTCFAVVKKILDSNEPMVATSKKDPKWKQDLHARLNPVFRDTWLLQYNYSMGNFYMTQQHYDSAVIFIKSYISIQNAFTEQLKDQIKISKFAKLLLPDSFKLMDKENTKYAMLGQQLGGDKLQLVIALAKGGKKEEALPFTNTWLEKAYYHHVINEPEKSEAVYQDIYKQITELSNSRFYKWTATTWKNLVDPQYLLLQCYKKNFAFAYPQFKKQLEQKDKSLQEDFAYFSENEKKEYFEEYAKKVSTYYSLLLAMAEQEPSKRLEMLNKTLQTKGLIMEATKEQEKRLKSVSDPELLNDINNIVYYREKLMAFNQLNGQHHEPLLDDSISYYTMTVNRLQKKVNEKIGVPKTILKPVTWQDIQSKLKPTEAYAEVIKVRRDNFHFDQPVVEYWAFIVKSTGEPVALQLGKGKEFEKGVSAYQNLMRFQMDDADSYNQYWKTLAGELTGKTKVFFSADGIYHLINPLTLKNPSTNKYVLEEIELVRLSTGRDLLQPTSAATTAKTSVLIGNPDFTMSRKADNVKVQQRSVPLAMISELRSGFAILPGAEKEVTAISLYANTARSEVILLKGADATEARVKKIANPGVLHFATHGIFDTHYAADSYLRSKLVLAGAGDTEPFTLDDYALYEDGYLTAYEVSQLNLTDTRLVVLSACETGLGEVQSGEGVWGLQRAFQMAGSRHILGSLWKISDEATAMFMDTFYKSYYQGATVRASYITAMKETRNKYPHPYFWGAFVLTGME